MVVSISINICWHFLVNWVPTYLKEERGLAFQTGNFLSAIPFLAADGGNLRGGWLVAPARRARPDARARPAARHVGVCTLLITVRPRHRPGHDDPTAVVLLSVMAAGTAAFMANYFAFTQEVSSRHTGLVVGYLGAIGRSTSPANDLSGHFEPLS